MSLGDLMLRVRRLAWRLLGFGRPPPGITAESAGDLFDRGIELATRGRIADALHLAEKLKSYRYTGAFELEAVALHEAGDADGAIAALRRGLDKKRVWRLGHLLGIYLSDEGRYEEALEAFDASLTMHSPQPCSTAYNRAIALNRADRTEEAIEVLRGLVSSNSTEQDSDITVLANIFLEQLTALAPQGPPPRRRTKSRPRAKRRS